MSEENQKVAEDAEPKGRPGYDYRMTKQEIAELALFRFQGSVDVIDQPDQVGPAVAVLEQERALGFDTETRPSFKKGQSFKPAILQLSTQRQAYLFMLKKIGMPSKLCRLLANKKIVKAGVAPGQDVRKLQELAEFDGNHFIDLSDMSRDLGIMNHGMRGIAAVLLGQRMSKRAQVSNWEKYPLEDFQVQYAAMDAWLSLELFFTMRDKHSIRPKPIDYLMPEPEEEAAKKPRRPRRKKPVKEAEPS